MIFMDRIPMTISRGSVHGDLLPGESLRTEESGELQSMGSQRVRHD